MPKFRVELTALAEVRQIQHIEADSAEEAQEIAEQNHHNHVWSYNGVSDESTVEATAYEEGN